MSTQSLKTTNLILRQKDREFLMREEKFIRVQLKAKVVTLCLGLTESSLENYQSQDLLEIYKQSFLSTMVIPKY
jgi:hypothetical protein